MDTYRKRRDILLIVVKKKSEKHRNHLLRRSLKEALKLQRNNRDRKRGIYHKYSSYEITRLTIRIPSHFTLMDAYDNQLMPCIAKIKRMKLLHRKIRLDFSGVERIDEGAIAVLLSVMRGCDVVGNSPTNTNARKIFRESGFYAHVNSNDDAPKSKNAILMIGGFETDRSGIKFKTRGGEMEDEIEKSTETVWGRKAKNPLLVTILLEMMANTQNHAFTDKRETQWFLSASHTVTTNKVQFTFVDNGKGILKTLYGKSKAHRLKKTLLADKGNLLKSVFEDKESDFSQTGLEERGLGLPTIHRCYKESKTIDNLVVITNGVFLDFKNDVVHKMGVEFTGTCYCFEINRLCVNNILQKQAI